MKKPQTLNLLKLYSSIHKPSDKGKSLEADINQWLPGTENVGSGLITGIRGNFHLWWWKICYIFFCVWMVVRLYMFVKNHRTDSRVSKRRNLLYWNFNSINLKKTKSQKNTKVRNVEENYQETIGKLALGPGKMMA